MRRAEKVKRARQEAETLGAKLGRVRALRGLTMAQVEKLVGRGIERSALSRIEDGSRPNPSLASLQMLAIAYDMDIQIRRDGEIRLSGTRLTELAEAERRAQLPPAGSRAAVPARGK